MNECKELRDHNQALTEANRKYVGENKAYKSQVSSLSLAVL